MGVGEGALEKHILGVWIVLHSSGGGDGTRTPGGQERIKAEPGGVNWCYLSVLPVSFLYEVSRGQHADEGGRSAVPGLR